MLIAPIWLQIRTSNFRNTFPGQTVKEFRWQVQPFWYTRVTDVRTIYGIAVAYMHYSIGLLWQVKSNAINFQKKPSGTPGGCLRLLVYGRLSLVFNLLFEFKETSWLVYRCEIIIIMDFWGDYVLMKLYSVQCTCMIVFRRLMWFQNILENSLTNLNSKNSL